MTDDIIIANIKDIILDFKEFYVELFDTKAQLVPVNRNVFNAGPTLSLGDRLALVQPITLKDIKEVLFI